MHVSFSDLERTYLIPLYILQSIDTTRAFQGTKFTDNSHFFSTSLPKEHRKLENGDLEHVMLLVIIELTTEFTLMIRLGEPRIRDGKRSTERRAGAKWFTCMCCSYPSSEDFCSSTQIREHSI